MGLRIQTNVQALAAQRNLNNTNMKQQKSMEKLASGSRIVRSADDAAGMAISEGMLANIRSIRQNVRNSNDGIGMIQTAEGGMNEISNILVRFRELSIQAASDTVGDNERAMIQEEVDQLMQEVDRISNSTEFNGRKLLDGEGDVLEFQIGQHNNPELDRITFDSGKANSTTDALGISGVNVESKGSAQENLEVVDNAIQVLNRNRSALGAVQNRLQSTVNNLRIYDENLSAARSQIKDVDIATETSENVKQSILANAGTSVLSQANQSAQLALQLL